MPPPFFLSLGFIRGFFFRPHCLHNLVALRLRLNRTANKCGNRFPGPLCGLLRRFKCGRGKRIAPTPRGAPAGCCGLSPIASPMARLIKPFTLSPVCAANVCISSFRPFGIRTRTLSYAFDSYFAVADFCAFDTVMFPPPYIALLRVRVAHIFY